MEHSGTISPHIPELQVISEHKLQYTGLHNRYTVIGNLSRNLAFMRVTLLVQNLDTSHRQRVSLDLFDTATLSRIAGEVASAFHQHAPDVEAEFLYLSDLLEGHRDQNHPTWKPTLRLIYPIQTQSYLDHLNGFRTLLRAQGYQNALYLVRPCENFLYFMERQGITDITTILPHHVLEYRETLCEQMNSKHAGGLGESHIREHLFSLRLFFSHLMDADILTHSPVVILRYKNEPHPEPCVLSLEEITSLYEACQNQFEKALLALCYGCGLRRSEAITLTLPDIDFEQGMLTVRSGKFNKTRTIPMADHVLDDLHAYITGERLTCITAKKSTSPHVLISSRAKPFSKTQLQYKFRLILARSTHPRIQFKQASLQSLRRSIATHLLNKGADFEFVQNFLGHTLLDTTHLYSRKRKLKERFLKEAFDYDSYPNVYPPNQSTDE